MSTSIFYLKTQSLKEQISKLHVFKLLNTIPDAQPIQ